MKKAARCKAHPSEFPGYGPVTVTEAYNELSLRAFAIWMRLLQEPQEVLSKGKLKLFKLLGYDAKVCRRGFQELERRGYIELVSRDGYPTALLIQRKCVINARVAGYVRLS